MSDTPETLFSLEVTAGKDGTKPVTEEYHLMSIHILKDINKISPTTLTFVDGGVAEFDKFAVADSGLFDRGNRVVIKAGYNNTVEPIFEGHVFDHELQLGNSKQPNKFIVKCQNQAKYLTLASMDEVLVDKTPLKAVEHVLKNNKHSKKAPGSVENIKDEKAEIQEQIILDPQTNCWDFIKKNLANFIAIPEDQKLLIDTPDLKTVDPLKIEYGHNLYSFSVKENPEVLQPLKIMGYDEKKPDEELSTEKDTDQLYGSYSSHMNKDTKDFIKGSLMPKIISGTHIHTQADIDNIIETVTIQNMLAFKSGKITIIGTNKAKLATTVEVVGLPDSYSTNFFVGGIEHKIDKGWKTSIKVGLSTSGLGKLGRAGKKGGGSSSAGSAKNGTVTSGGNSGADLHGNLTIGRIVSIKKETNEFYKMVVKLTKLNNKEVNARMMQPYAGSGNDKDSEGMFFFPNVGAEVILTPIDGDENYWIILGGLYGPKHNAPSGELKTEDTLPDEKNLHKSIVTKHFILDFYDDDAKTRMTLASRDGTTGEVKLADKKYQISMDIKDKPNIQIQFDKTFIKLDEEHGVMIESAKNITLKAKENIEIQGKKITTTADTDVEVSGQNIKQAAKVALNAEGAQVQVKGKSTVKVESGAMAEFAGSMTKIGK